MSYNPANPNGQTTKANSAPVTLASDQNNALETGGNLATTATNTGTVSGAVSSSKMNVNITGFALDATLTGGTQQSKITDGTNVTTVKAASTAAIATDKAVVVAVSPNNTIPVSIATNQPTLQSGSTTAVTQATASNLNATVVGTGTFAVQDSTTETNTGTIATNTTGLNSTVGTTGSAVPSKGQLIQGSDGTNARNVLTDTVGRLTVTVPGSVSVVQSSPGNLNANVTPINNTTSAVGSYALPIGIQAVSADPSATTTTYNTAPISDLIGKQITLPYAIPQKFVNGATSTTATTSTSLISAVTSNKIYLTSVQVMNTGATTTQIALQDGTSPGTTKAYVQAPAGGGSNITFPVPIANTSGNAWYFACGSASTTIYISAQGYASTN
jgi:hypothetical protein